VEKLKIIETANAEQRTGEIQQAMEGADLVIALSKPGPGTLKKRNGLS
jgi:malate dehydrogenase (oxaloacetate-decarboxylating)